MKVTVLVGLLSLALPAVVQADSPRKFKLQFEQAPVVEVVKWFSAKTGKNFIISDGERERLTIISGSKVTEPKAWEALTLALRDKELALLDKGSFYRIVHARRLKRTKNQDRAEKRHVREVTLACRDDEACALPPLNQQARLVPAFEKGKPVGVKIFGLADDSFYKRVGLKDGDTLLRIDGQAVLKPEQVLKALQRVGDGEGVKVDLLRRGKRISSTWLIRRQSASLEQ